MEIAAIVIAGAVLSSVFVVSVTESYCVHGPSR